MKIPEMAWITQINYTRAYSCVYCIYFIIQNVYIFCLLIQIPGASIKSLLHLWVLFHRWTQRCVETLRESPLRDRVWTHIESRQFIGWWRDAISDAMTSSGHTGERAIHSSDFSAFTKRSHYPSLLRFLTQLTFLRSSICTSATASVELCSPRGEVPWNIAFFNRRARDSSLAMTRTDKYNYVFRVHACGLWDLNVICENLCLITLRSRLEVCEKESSIFSSRHAPEASAASRESVASRESATWGSDV